MRAWRRCQEGVGEEGKPYGQGRKAALQISGALFPKTRGEGPGTWGLLLGELLE